MQLVMLLFIKRNKLFFDNFFILERQQIRFEQVPQATIASVYVIIFTIDQWMVLHWFSEIVWPSDLTALDFFLQGYLKQKLYIQGLFRDVDYLERIITEKVRFMVRNVLMEFYSRSITCMNRVS